MERKHCLCLTGIFSAIFCVSCATPTVVQSVKPGDTGLSCSQLQNELADTERFRAEADREKGMTGGNVVRALFFWPAILGSFSNANEAIAAADARKVSLSNLMNQKNCAVSTTAASSDLRPSDASRAPAINPQSQEQRLVELKRLYDANLITRDVYIERQKAILASP